MAKRPLIEAWETFRDEALPTNMTPEQLRVEQTIFTAGAAALIEMMLKAKELGSQENFRIMMEGVGDDIKSVFNDCKLEEILVVLEERPAKENTW